MRRNSSFLLSTLLMAGAAHAEDSTKDLLSMSLAELSDIVVTSVSKRETNYQDAAAALYVLTSEEIKRSGATSIPEALRLVPGLQVARSSGSQWAITARGFNSQFANKLLVLIDGRSVYTPLFSGVFWDVQNVLMEDVERIEVIRGPAATLWGSNAVDGVINVITKKAYDTVGNYATALIGNEEGMTAFRHGEGDDKSAWRIYGKISEDKGGKAALDSKPARDDIASGQSGFRRDWADGASSYTVQGDAYREQRDTSWYLPALSAPYYSKLNDTEELQGANIIGRWTHNNGDGDTTLQAYIDYVSRYNSVLRHRQFTADIDFQRSLKFNATNNIVWGAGLRSVSDDNQGSYYVNFNPDSRTNYTLSSFIQDDIALTDSITLTPGSKFELNSYTGFEIQPSIKMAWKANQENRVWAVASRSLRTADRSGNDMNFTTGVEESVPAFTRLIGNKDLKSEEMWSFELGHRYIPAKSFSIDSTLYYNIYDHIVGYTPGTPFVDTSSSLPPHVVIPAYLTNGLNSRIYGAETSVEWQARDDWKLAVAYTLSFVETTGNDGLIMTGPDSSPQHQVQLKSFFDVTPTIKWDNFIYYVDNVPDSGADAYVRFDSRIAWQITPAVEVSITGQNLLDNSHKEFKNFIYEAPAEIDRRIYGQIKWHF